jgi:hypothetical protein
MRRLEPAVLRAAADFVHRMARRRVRIIGRRLKALEDENRRLKRMVADQALNIQVLKDALGKEW